MSKFENFRSEYEARQSDRPKVRPECSETLQNAAAEYAQASERLLERFFVGLTQDEKEQILEELDMTDGLNRAIVQEARRLYLIRK